MQDSSIDATNCFNSNLLDGQVAIVTGGATGIGKEICRVLGGHGARITMVSRKQENLETAPMSFEPRVSMSRSVSATSATQMRCAQ